MALLKYHIRTSSYYSEKGINARKAKLVRLSAVTDSQDLPQCI